MRKQPLFRFIPLLLLAAVLALSGCAAPAQLVATTQPAATGQPAAATQPEPPPETVPAQTETPAENGSEDSASYTGLDEFKAALLQAMMDRDTEKLKSWMTEPFLTGGWRADGSYTAPEDALRELYDYYLGAENTLEWVEGADLIALMGETDPLDFPRAEAGVIEAALVGGWGMEGRDEAVLFIARAADGSLKWHGWIVIQGGFSGARLGGAQSYTNQAHGFRFFLPQSAEVQETGEDTVLILAPGAGHPGEGRAAAFIEVGPAGGRSVEEVVEQVKADLGPGFEIPPGTAMGLDKAMAIVLYGLPGQDSNRQLFVVYNDLLYHITFVPDNPQVGAAYQDMEDLYAMIVNTFHFTN